MRHYALRLLAALLLLLLCVVGCLQCCTAQLVTDPLSGPGSTIFELSLPGYTPGVSTRAFGPVDELSVFGDGTIVVFAAIYTLVPSFSLSGALILTDRVGNLSTVDPEPTATSLFDPATNSSVTFADSGSVVDLKVDQPTQLLVVSDGGCSYCSPVVPPRVLVVARNLTVLAIVTTFYGPGGEVRNFTLGTALLHHVGGQTRLVIGDESTGLVSVSDLWTGDYVVAFNLSDLLPYGPVIVVDGSVNPLTNELSFSVQHGHSLDINVGYVVSMLDASGVGDYKLSRSINVTSLALSQSPAAAVVGDVAFDSVGRTYVEFWVSYSGDFNSSIGEVSEYFSFVAVYAPPDPQDLTAVPWAVALLNGSDALTNYTDLQDFVGAVAIDPTDNSLLVDNLFTVWRLAPFPQTSGSVKGDPAFVGLRGQSFQVHGLDGVVYALVSSPYTAVNARFVFLSSGRCPVVEGEVQPSCWSHPGSYLGAVSVQERVEGAGVQRLLLAAGAASTGFSAVQLNGQRLQVGDAVQVGSLSVSVLSGWRVAVSTRELRFVFDNSDGFINQAVSAQRPLSELRAHGLLGQTHSPVIHPSRLRYIEGDVDDYAITDNDLFGHAFAYDRFAADN